MGEQRAGFGRCVLALGLAVILGLAPLGLSARAQDLGGTGHGILLAQGAAKKKALKAKKGKADADASAKAKAKAEAEAAKAPAVEDKTPKFSRDVAPVLVGNCINCHDPKSNNERAHVLDLTTFKSLMAGSKSRKVIEPSRPDASPLILRIRGDEAPRMPQNRNDPIADPTIEKIAEWIKVGATLDAGKDPGALITSYAVTPEQARLEALNKLNANDRDRRVIDSSLERWKKVIPDAPPEALVGTRVILFHNLPKPRAEALKKLLDAQVVAIRKFLGPQPSSPLDGPLKVSVYVFNDATNFVELARTVESREMDEGTLASANLGDPIPYIAALDPLGGQEEVAVAKKEKGGAASAKGFGGVNRNLGALLTEQLAAASLAPGPGSKAPRWLRAGMGALFASKIEPRNVYYRQLRANAFEQYQANWAEQAKSVLSDGTDADKLRAGGFSLVEWLAKTQSDVFPTFVLGMMDGGDKLDASLENLWGMKRDDFVTAWGAWIAEEYGR